MNDHGKRSPEPNTNDDTALQAYWSRQRDIRKSISADQFGDFDIPLTFSALGDVYEK